MENLDAKKYFLTLTPGKLAGLRAITDESGKFKVLALDQSNSFRKSLSVQYQKSSNPHDPSYEEIRDAKMQITGELSFHATAVLLDVNYGLGEAIAGGFLAKGVALIGRIEASKDAGISAEIENGWSVKQIKQIGCAAVKLLVYMDVENLEFTQSQIEFVKKISLDCEREDILLMVEELTFPRDGESKESNEFITRKPNNIIESARLLGPHCDILKVEFPGSENLAKLNEVAIRPWVLLSAGQPYDDFVLQVKSAMEAGSSGIMAGRAIFNEYFTFATDQEKIDFLNGKAISRMVELGRIVDESATSWLDRYQIRNEDLARELKQDWYKTSSTTLKETEPISGEY